MKLVFCLLLGALSTSTAYALESGEAWVSVADGQVTVNSTGAESSSAKVMLDAAPSLASYSYSQLTALGGGTNNAWPVGSLAWCSDCAATNPCFTTASGGGAVARKEGAASTAWNCARGNEIDHKVWCHVDGGGSCSGGGTWTKADIKFSAKQVIIRCLSGGGGGGSGGVAPASAQGGAGGGGGAGGSLCETFLAWDTVPSSLTVEVGAGGKGGDGVTGTVATTGNVGAPGTNSLVKDSSNVELCKAGGGNGGGAGTGNTSGGGGAVTSYPRPWGNYAGGAGRQAASPATTAACASAGPYTTTCAGNTTVVAPFGTFTYAAGSGGGGGTAGNSAPTAGGDGGRSLSAPAKTAGAVATNGQDGDGFSTAFGQTTGRAGGGGSGGGGRATAGVAGAGGAGGYPGGGGGGGGGHLSATGNTSGAGGKGAGGYCEIITLG